LKTYVSNKQLDKTVMVCVCVQFKGLVHPNMKIMLLMTHPHIIMVSH